jgi:hypothetical protein
MAATGVNLTPWPQAAREYVEAQQERHYRKLAEALGLGSDPKAAYERVSGEEMPRDHTDPCKLRYDYGADSVFSASQWSQFGSQVDTIWRRISSLQPPTSYEDPNLYRSLLMTYEQVQAPLAVDGSPPPAQPLLATLAAGHVNAIMSEEPNTNAPLLYFERGLFKFFHQFAMLTAWCSPPIPLQNMYDDQALADMPRRYTMPAQSSEFFLQLYSSYAITGVPIRIQDIAVPSHNIFTAIYLLQAMERFMMAHELGHLRLGHLQHPYRDKAGAWDQEFHADVEGLSLMQAAQWRAVDFWAVDLAMTALHFLDLALVILTYGARGRWMSQTHPDYLSRRKYLREAVEAADSIPKPTRSATYGLWRMNDALFQRLWEIASPFLLLAYTQSQRPSPMWGDRIRTSFENPTQLSREIYEHEPVTEC